MLHLDLMVRGVEGHASKEERREPDALERLADDEVARYAAAFRENFSKRAPSGDSPVQHVFQEGAIAQIWARDREEQLAYGKSLTINGLKIKLWELVAISRKIWEDNTTKRRFPRSCNKAIDGTMIDAVNGWLKKRSRPQLHLPSCWATAWPCLPCINTKCINWMCLSGACPFCMWSSA